MRRILLILLLSALYFAKSQAQTVSVVSPSGLSEPYEVTPGTEVTLRWDNFGEAPNTFFTHSIYPELSDFEPNPEWHQFDTFVDNGDGTFDVTITVNEPVFAWGGFFSSWISLWQYSNVLEIGISSPVKITALNNKLCDNGSDIETISAVDSYTSYQWYHDNELIAGATSSTYQASQPGKYKVLVPFEGEEIFSNTVNLSFIEVQMTGSVNADQLTLTASEGMDSYQWFTGIDEASLALITNATAQSHSSTLAPQQYYYSVQAVMNGCTVQSQARPASLSMLTVPVIEVVADKNEFGKVCAGSLITLYVPSTYASYKWYMDGYDAYNNFSVQEISSVYQQGTYTVEVMPSDWPEIKLMSEGALASYFTLIEPILTGAESYSVHCPAENINITLADEGYTYSWYQHESYDFSETDKVIVPGYTHSFTFQNQIYISVVANFLGCSASKKIFLTSYAKEYLSLDLRNGDQAYLCSDSTARLKLSTFHDPNKYENYQWYKKTNDSYQIIPGQTAIAYVADEPGEYALEVNNKNCPAVRVKSSSRLIQDYTERKMILYADKEAICLNEQTLLHISGGSEWKSIQWFEGDVVIGTTAYEEIFIPLANSGAGQDQSISKFNRYQAKAKHKSCPNGLKTTSKKISIKPSLNPTIIPDHSNGVYDWHTAPYDSIAQYVYCEDESLSLSVPPEFDSYSWHKLSYMGDDDYALGDAISGADGNALNMKADVAWFTAQVEIDGCIGLSDPVLIDAYVFQNPDIASLANTELCKVGDSTKLWLAFPGNWDRFEWYRDDKLVPNSNSEFIYASDPGVYSLVAFPSLCPQFAHNSGPGPWVRFLEARIEQTDTLVYAEPWQGNYKYQWYFKGKAIDTLVWIHKDQLASGTYTVQVTNVEGCSDLSDEFQWIITGAEKLYEMGFNVYPNPTSGPVNVNFTNWEQVDQIQISNMNGQSIYTGKSGPPQFDLSNYPPGVYILNIRFNDGTISKAKIIRK